MKTLKYFLLENQEPTINTTEIVNIFKDNDIPQQEIKKNY